MKREKLTKIFPEKDLLGKTQVEVAINIQLIWEITKNEKKFIKLFSRIYIHEILHSLIQDILRELNQCGEEVTIRTLLGGEWSEELSRFYKCDK